MLPIYAAAAAIGVAFVVGVREPKENIVTVTTRSPSDDKDLCEGGSATTQRVMNGYTVMAQYNQSSSTTILVIVRYIYYNGLIKILGYSAYK